MQQSWSLCVLEPVLCKKRHLHTKKKSSPGHNYRKPAHSKEDPVQPKKKPPDSSGAGEHAVLMTTVEPLPLTAFSQALEFLDLSLRPLCFTQVLSLQVLLRIYAKVSLFWLRPCSIFKYSFGTLLWFCDQNDSLKLASPGHSSKSGVVSLKLFLKNGQDFSDLTYSFGMAVFWRWLKKSLWPGSHQTNLSS